MSAFPNCGASWHAADHMVKLADTNPPLPASFNNRLQMNWKMLLAIADLADGKWPKSARAAAIRLSRERDEPSLGKRLLRAFQIMFAEHGSLLTSKQVEASLPPFDEEWANYKGRGRAINRWEIAALLRPYGIRPGVIHPRGRPADRGYDESQFTTAFRHFLPETTVRGRTVVRKPRSRRRK